jgi:hypothetical protein
MLCIYLRYWYSLKNGLLLKIDCQVELVETGLLIAFDKLRLTTLFKLYHYFIYRSSPSSPGMLRPVKYPFSPAAGKHH